MQDAGAALEAPRRFEYIEQLALGLHRMQRDELSAFCGAASRDAREDINLLILRAGTSGPKVEADLADEARGGKLRLEDVERIIERAELGRADPPGVQAEPEAHGGDVGKHGGEALVFGGRDGVGEGGDARVGKRMRKRRRVICEARVHVHVNETDHGSLHRVRMTAFYPDDREAARDRFRKGVRVC